MASKKSPKGTQVMPKGQNPSGMPKGTAGMSKVPKGTQANGMPKGMRSGDVNDPG